MSDPGTITQLLIAAEKKEPGAANELYRKVEKDLVEIARCVKQRRVLPGNLDAKTESLVDDAFRRLVGQDVTTWQPGDRLKFKRYAARKIQDLLIDELRKHLARGGGIPHDELADKTDKGDSGKFAHQLQLKIDMRNALEQMDQFEPVGADLIRFRYFLGMTYEESAEELGISKTTAFEIHEHSLMWLRGQLGGYELDS